jgi:hypothetical protein
MAGGDSQWLPMNIAVLHRILSRVELPANCKARSAPKPFPIHIENMPLFKDDIIVRLGVSKDIETS